MTLWSVEGLRPKSFSIEYTVDGSKTSAVIRLSLSPTADTKLLDMGKKHVFASWRKRLFLAFVGRRRIREFSIAVERKSDLTPGRFAGIGQIADLGLSEAKIGFLCFQPPTKRGRFRAAFPAYIQGIVFVSDELHESLRNILQAGKIPTWLRLTLWLEDGVLKYAEPDGSRMVWKVENENEQAFVNLTSISIHLRGWRPLRSSLLALLQFVAGY